MKLSTCYSCQAQCWLFELDGHELHHEDDRDLAEEIVRRYNAHDDLVGLLKELASLGAFIGDRLPIKVAQPIFKKLQATLSDL